jgi:hypothetical protein
MIKIHCGLLDKRAQEEVGEFLSGQGNSGQYFYIVPPAIVCQATAQTAVLNCKLL